MDPHAHIERIAGARAATQRDRRVWLGACQLLRQSRQRCCDDPVRRLARVGASTGLQLACGERRLASRLRRVPRARSRGRVLGLRHREVAADPVRPLPVHGAVASAHRHGDRDGGARRHRDPRVLAPVARLALGRRARGVLRADERRRPRPWPRRHGPVGRPAADGAADVGRNGRINPNRHPSGARAPLRAAAAAFHSDALHRAGARRPADHRAVHRIVRVSAAPATGHPPRRPRARCAWHRAVPGRVHGGSSAWWTAGDAERADTKPRARWAFRGGGCNRR